MTKLAGRRSCIIGVLGLELRRLLKGFGIWPRSGIFIISQARKPPSGGFHHMSISTLQGGRRYLRSKPYTVESSAPGNLTLWARGEICETQWMAFYVLFAVASAVAFAFAFAVATAAAAAAAAAITAAVVAWLWLWLCSGCACPCACGGGCYLWSSMLLIMVFTRCSRLVVLSSLLLLVVVVAAVAVVLVLLLLVVAVV